MRKKTYSLLALVAMLILLLASCSEASEQNQEVLSRSVTVSIGQATARTLLPAEPVEADYYTVTLTPKQQDGSGNWVDVSNQTAITRKIENGETSVTLQNVMIGSYEVTVEGYKVTEGSAVKVMKNDAGQIESITPTGENKISVTLKLITDSGNGSIEVVFDWTDVYYLDKEIKDATDSGNIKIQMFFKESANAASYTDFSTQTVPAEDKTTYTFKADNVPVTTSGIVYFNFYAGNTLIISNYRISAVQIYAGHTSTPDVNEDKIYSLSITDITRGKNVSNVNWEYVAEGDGTSALITWDNVTNKNGDVLLDEVYLSFKDSDGNVRPATQAVSERTGSYEFTGMVEGKVYTLSIQAHFKSGRVSNMDEVLFTESLKAKKFVQNIEIEGIPSDPLTPDTQFTLSVKFTPSDATVQDYEWTINNPSVLESTGSKDEFKAIKPGVSTITVTSTDTGNKSDTSAEVKVKLAEPVNVTATATTSGIELSWTKVAFAESYVITRTVNGTNDTTDISVVSGTSYTDTDICANSTYSYSVKALATTLNTDSFSVDSDSTTSNVIEVKGTTIEVTKPTLDKNEIIFTDVSIKNPIYVSKGSPLSLTIGEISGVSEYSWLLNGTVIKNGNDEDARTISISGDEDGINEETPLQYLTISVTKNKTDYSKTISFIIVNEYVEDEGLTLSIKEGNATRLSNNLADGSKRTVQLVPTVAPSNATNKNVSYVSNDESIATVTADGVVTFEGGYGEVTITATSYSGHEASITFDVYKATIVSAEQLLDIVNTEVGKNIKAANDSNAFDNGLGYKNDWWSPTQLTWNGTNVEIKNCTGSDWSTPSTLGSISFNNYKFETEDVGELEFITSVIISLDAQDTGSKGNLGSDRLKTVGVNDDNLLEVTLPYNQGTATIHYDNINVYGDTRSGSYTVEFKSIVGYDDSFTGGRKTIDDSKDIVRLFTN